ncbi:helix-turn-helix domain-containing protein [Montanilutibacter psychrotolerans]|uniref:AraC family transcriptional regulator n=1 Tax=Montanilutibacter psychrotolerans TaxID=1327343 RepID=A0A3M8T472_9GAMM|nr:helix-turn-helix domain-containing protein [Lysobacter psychrotolerans]RNF86486.1 AraC family transcriptional regulator [Lysobacter psychrotolerans]
MLKSHLLFFFAGLGAFNGLALSLYLLWRQPATPAQRWLAALVLMLSIRTGKSVLFYFWPEVSKLVLQVGLTACLLIGPCLIGFVRAWADPQRRHTRKDPLFGWGLLALATGFGVAFPYADHVGLWAGAVWRWIQFGWLACLLVAGGLFVRATRQQDSHDAGDGLARGHVAAVVAGVAVIWLAYFTAGLTSYIVGALSFSLVLYLSAIVALAQRRKRRAAAPYQDRKIAPGEAEAALQSLHTLMAQEHLYKDASLTLARLARRLNMTPARLSQLLNDNHKTAFRQYLVQLRVEAAKGLLSTPDLVSMEQVAEASGFLSMSTFYTSFKKVEGTTPAAWRQMQLRSNADS